MANILSQKMEVANHYASRVIRTESAFRVNEVDALVYKDCGLESYIILATLDLRTSEVCQKQDLKEYKLKNKKVGVNYPPFHPYCRTVTMANVSKEELQELSRKARDPETGHSIDVPGDVDYKEWKDSLVPLSEKGKVRYFGRTYELKVDKENSKIEIGDWEGLNYTQSYNKKTAIDRLNTEYGIQFIDSRKYPMDEKLLADCVGWMDSFSSQYPDFMQSDLSKLPKIACNPPSKMNGSVGYYTRYVSSGNPIEIALNGEFHSNTITFKKYVNRAIEAKYYPNNATIHKTFIHEFGHHVSNSLGRINDNKHWENEFINSCIAEFKKNEPNYISNSYKGMKEFVSSYAASSESELFAEAFVEYFGGENPREFAQLFGSKLITILKGVK